MACSTSPAEGAAWAARTRGGSPGSFAGCSSVRAGDRSARLRPRREDRAMRERRAPRAGVAALALAAASVVPAVARAQAFGGIALDQLSPAPPGDTFTSVPSPFAAGHLVPRGLVLFDYAARPLTLVTTSSSRPVVSGQGLLHVGASLALWARLLPSLSLPLALVQSGEAPSAGRFTFVSPSSPQVGDLRLG